MAIKILIYILVVLGVAASALTWRVLQQEARAERLYPPEGQLLDVDGVQVHAVVMGDGPDLVLIHGSSGNTRDMTFSLAPKLAERYRVIVFDRPGLGYTDRLNGDGASIFEQAELMAKAAAQLGAERPIVMGQSYGGSVALAWAVTQPDHIAALVPLAAPSNPWTTPLDPYYQVLTSWWGNLFVVPLLTAFVSDARVEETLEGIFAPQSAPDGYAEAVGAGLTLRRKSLRANAAQRANLLDEIKALQPRYGEINVPTEIVHGTDDTTVGLPIHSEKLVHQIDGAVLTRLAGIGHMPHHVDQDDVIAAIDRAARRANLR
ncbi:alpha/beta fold hydrolase [Thalassococcus sp. S3]|uniref:alpha/beta fold hydrolase n=1 Tax=Thalassococcus sp. S3 TaxID=2017482 RepID=UPI0020C4F12B|nr:alpha/beta hydrolase [Thalassococcus sp. S3]